MLTKFISVSETHFQNTETALKNQQAIIQRLETQIGSLSSNTKSNLREQINAITIQDEEGLVAPEPEHRQETVGSKALSQMPNAVKFLKELLKNKRKLDEASHVELDAETILKNLHELCSSNNKGPIYEERRLKIEELGELQTQKLRTLDKPKPSQDKLNISPNKLKVGDKVLLDAADPRITTSEPNEEIPLTVLSIFPYGTVKLNHSKFENFKENNTSLKPYIDKVNSRDEELGKIVNQHGRETLPCCETVGGPVKLARAFDTPVPNPRGRHYQPNMCVGYHTWAWEKRMKYTMSSSSGKKTAIPVLKKKKGAASSSSPTAEIRHPFLEFPLGPQEELFQTLWGRPLVRALLTTNPWGLFFEIVELTYLELTLELCSTFHLQTVMTNFNDPGTVQFCLGGLERGHLYRALCDSTGLELRAPQHSSTIILLHSHRPDVPTGHPEQLSMRMIEKRRGTYPLQYRLVQSTEEEDPEDITDDVPPRHDDSPSQPPPIYRPVHMAASYSDISERLTQFEQ
ncbi:hypothetical protein GOBAR_AA37693 [Gossypium barbadense]|uniref:Uncharacterized protein n=1 Tax=Gossypium barbadense TaxID=3634 RepID=A0A2P5VW02_GOSBA|nr:hypothetical protein GOBAR_AA37693 [Gossypium barbadense]